METKITHKTLNGQQIWFVHYYSDFACKWIMAGDFDTHEQAVSEASTWGG